MTRIARLASTVSRQLPGRTWLPGLAWLLAGLLALMVVMDASPTAAAEALPGNPIKMFQQMIADAEDDPSVAMFKAIFPSLFGDEQSSVKTVTVIGHLTQFLTTITLSVGILWLIYHVVAGTLQTAHEGELLGRAWSSLWAPIRVVVGIVMLIPLSDGWTGFQYAIKYVTLAGVGSANYAWDIVVDDLVDGVPLSEPVHEAGFKLAYQTLETLTCAYAYNEAVAALGGGTSGITGTTLETKVVQDDADTYGGVQGWLWNLWMDGPKADTVMDKTSRQVLRQDIIIGGLPGTGLPEDVCGRVLFESIMDSGSLVTAGDFSEFSKAYNNLVVGLTPIVKDLVAKVIAGDKDISVDHKQIIKAVEAYDAAIAKHLTSRLGALRGANVGAKVADLMRQGGWMYAGSFYPTLERMNKEWGALAAAGPTVTGPNYDAILTSSAVHGRVLEPAIAAMQGNFERISKENLVLIPGESDRFGNIGRLGSFYQGESAGYAECKAAQQEIATSPDPTRPLPASCADVMQRQQDAVAKSMDQITYGHNGDFVDRLGKNYDIASRTVMRGLFLNIIAGDSWLSPLTALSSGGRGLIVGGGGLLVVNGVFDKANLDGGLMEVVSTALLAGGAYLGYIVPMLPFIFFFLAYLAWCIKVIESVVFASVWAFAHLRMDGDGFAGPAAGNGYSLVFRLFWKPLGMVIGLAMVVAILPPIIRIFTSMFYSGVDLSEGTSGFLSEAIYGIVFIILIGIIVNNAMSLITIGDRIGDWFDGRGDNSDVDGHASKMMGAVGVVPTQVVQQMGHMGRNIGKRARRAADKGKAEPGDSPPAP